MLGNHVRARDRQADRHGLHYDDHIDPGHGLFPRGLRQGDEQLLVLGPREEVPPVRRLQSRREHPAPDQQPGHGVDGDVLQPGPGRAQRVQAVRHGVLSVLDGADVQRPPQGRVQGVEVQQLLLRAAVVDAVLVRVASGLRHRLGATVLALRSVFQLPDDFPHLHQNAEAFAAEVVAQNFGLHSVAGNRHPSSGADDFDHLLLDFVIDGVTRSQ